MENRQFFLESITNTIADYRQDELDRLITIDHVDRWINQFDSNAQLPMLKELDHVLKQTYFSRADVERFLTGLITNDKLVGNNSLIFWKNVNFLNIQEKGNSQKEMLSIFDELLKKELQINLTECGSDNGNFIYLDDVTFSGNRIKTDLIKWIEQDCPQKAKIHIITIALYKSSEYVFREPIAKAIKQSGKEIEIKRWRIGELDNQLCRKDYAEVFWARELPDNNEVLQYCETLDRFPFQPRCVVSAENNCFSSEEGRNILEQQLLIAGVHIRSICTDPTPMLKPFGYSQFGLGFGSTIVTFRNCPNNTPIAFWWGDYQGIHGNSHPFSKWYPLFPRKTYDRTY